MNSYNLNRYDAALGSLDMPAPDNLEALMELWSVFMGGINALGGWEVYRVGGDRLSESRISNPAVFEQEPGITIRARVLELQEHWVELNRGDRPKGPCPTCNQPYEYEVFPSEARYKTLCGGCATKCGGCGITHEQSPYRGQCRGNSHFECIRALGKELEKAKESIEHLLAVAARAPIR